jgi:hypothetical protein
MFTRMVQRLVALLTNPLGLLYFEHEGKLARKSVGAANHWRDCIADYGTVAGWKVSDYGCE